ncbi:MAG TPA: type IIL restriction-modification enzyme MmeI, partial [Opitutales bacterium]|nr:type IIL restriction-modification enzyme MmeI [Opitutales bacterium]
MPNAPEPKTEPVDAFISRWQQAEASERANYQMFLTELCDLLELPHPDPAGSDNEFNKYVFDRAITRQKPDGSETTVWADLYKRGAFILETKQGAHADQTKRQDAAPTVEAASSRLSRKTGHGIRGTRQWDIALEKAYNQARGYIRDLPAAEGRPPFLIVCDVGYVIELYSEFTCTGGTYIRYPDPKNHRIYLEDLRDPEKRRLLRTIWTDPLSLDPSKHAARVTRDVAEHLARLAKSLEQDGHQPEPIAVFLQRCLFTLFAEDVGLLPENAFLDLLRKLKDNPEAFAITVSNLWKDMASEEEWSVALMQKIAYFNGGLFEGASALPLSAAQIALLIGAAQPDWSDVEPAIFGTLLERALSPQDRHKLGAHYTPRSYVERLVKPTVIDPLRAQWDAVKTAAAQFQEKAQMDKAIAAVKDFHHQLCAIRVLDPACGSGNFLYVTLEHMKRLEGEVLELLEALGDTELTFEMEQFKVRPQQFYGLELNERAVAIAQLVLWIGYFQWHQKTTGTADTKDRSLLPKQQTILRQDAVLAYDEQTPRTRIVAAASSHSGELTSGNTNTKRQDAASTVEAASSRLTPAERYSYYNPYKKVEITKAKLPHWRQDETTYFVTFRLADSLPKQKLDQWKEERDAWLAANPKPHTEEQKSEYFERFSTRMEAWLDAGHGDCILADPHCAKIVENALQHFDGDRYDLGEYTVASNHVHALVSPRKGHELSDIIHSWKSYTANELNKHLGRKGTVWQKEYYDHILRTAEAASRIERYIQQHETKRQ